MSGPTETPSTGDEFIAVGEVVAGAASVITGPVGIVASIIIGLLKAVKMLKTRARWSGELSPSDEAAIRAHEEDVYRWGDAPAPPAPDGA